MQKKTLVKGYALLPSVDYGDTFALIVRQDTIKLLLSRPNFIHWTGIRTWASLKPPKLIVSLTAPKPMITIESRSKDTKQNKNKIL